MSDVIAKENQQEGKKPSLISKIFNFFFYTLISIVIVVALLYTVVNLAGNNGISTILGHTVGSVQSGSMSGTFEKGDIIVSKQIDGEEVKEGDVISFWYHDPQADQIIVVTHRVIELRDDGKIVTQGDVANKANSVDKIEVISKGDVISRYSFKIPCVGAVLDFINTSTGFFVCILIPVFLFLFWQIYVFIVTVSDAKKLAKEKAIQDQARVLAEQMLKEREQNKEDEPASSESQE
jgi:signal peptidase